VRLRPELRASQQRAQVQELLEPEPQASPQSARWVLVELQAWVQAQERLRELALLRVQKREPQLVRPVWELLVLQRARAQVQLLQAASVQLQQALEVRALASTQQEIHFPLAKCGEPSPQHQQG
jgi:hypothetical protein